MKFYLKKERKEIAKDKQKVEIDQHIYVKLNWDDKNYGKKIIFLMQMPKKTGIQNMIWKPKIKRNIS